MQAGAMRSQPAKSVLTLIGRTTVPSEAFSPFINRRDAPQFVRFNRKKKVCVFVCSLLHLTPRLYWMDVNKLLIAFLLSATVIIISVNPA